MSNKNHKYLFKKLNLKKRERKNIMEGRESVNNRIATVGQKKLHSTTSGRKKIIG